LDPVRAGARFQVSLEKRIQDGDYLGSLEVRSSKMRSSVRKGSEGVLGIAHGSKWTDDIGPSAVS
jgi:hypothetical protein